MPSLPDVRLRFLRPWLDLLFWGLPLVCNYFGGWLKAGRVDLVATRAMGGKRSFSLYWVNDRFGDKSSWANRKNPIPSVPPPVEVTLPPNTYATAVVASGSKVTAQIPKERETLHACSKGT
jgi:hypothetical protein